MKKLWLRTLALLLCMAMLLSTAPVYSEETVISVVDAAEFIDESPAPEEIPAPEAAAEAAPELAEAPTAEPTVEITPEPTVEITPEPTPAPSAEPSPTAAPVESATPAPETIPVESAMPEISVEPIMLLSIEDQEAVVASWIAEMKDKKLSTEYQKALWLYKRLISSVKADNSSKADETAEAALVNGKAGSLGFALAYEALLDAANIASVVVNERGEEEEAWNVVRLDGKWTHIDAFSDARSGETGKHFGLTDGAMARIRSWNRNSASACTSAATNHYIREKSYIACTDSDALFELLMEALDLRTNVLKFYWAGEDTDLCGDFTKRILTVVAPLVKVSYDEDGCYCIVTLDHSKVPAPTATPAATVEPTAKPTFVPGYIQPDEIIPVFEAITLGVGEEYPLQWRFVPEYAESQLKFSSSASKYAAVNDEGLILARKAGNAVITIETENGRECSVKVTVKAAPKKISSFVCEKTELGAGESAATRFSFNSGAGGSVHYSSNDEDIAVIDANGVITAIAPGEAKISITSYNGISRSGQISVLEAPEYILLSEDEISLAANDTHRLTYELSDGSTGEVSFHSSDESVATVDENGRVHAVGRGVAVIFAETYNGMLDECIVTVAGSPDTVELYAPHTELGVGEKMQLTARLPEGTVGSLKYASSSTKCITVNDEGVVTAKRAGTAAIKVKTNNGKEAIIELTVKKAPKSINLSAESTTLGVGESTQLTVSLPSGTAGSWKLVSSDEKKLVIDTNGLATAIAPGDVEVTAIAYNGVKKSGIISIICEPETLTLSAETASIGLGDSWVIDYELNEGASSEIQFTSSDPSIASIDKNGEIRALKPGTVIITARTYNNVSASCVISVVSAPGAIVLDAPRNIMGVGEKMQLLASIQPEGTVGSLEFSSSNSKCIAVDNDGVVTAKRTGSATITVETYNGVKAQLKLSVKSSPDKVSFSADRTSLGLGETAQLTASLPSGTAGGYEFVSSDESKLIIDSNGLATAVGVGEVEVSVITYNGLKKSGFITIMNAPETITLNQTSVAIGAEDRWTLEYSLDAGAAGAVSFSSSDPSIAAVDESGEIRALKAGIAVISVESYNGLGAQCIVEVVAAPKEVILSAPRMEIGVGEKMQLSAETLPDGALGTLKYSTSNSKFVSVDDDGVVTGNRIGTATITVKTYNGVKGTIKISVKAAPASIALSSDRTTLGLGESAQLTASIPASSAGAYSIVSEDESILTIDENGVATAIAIGNARVTAIAYNGVKKSGVISVKAAPRSLSLDPSELVLGEDESAMIAAVLNAGSAGAVRYTSDNPEIAEVDPDSGEVTAMAIGSTSILAETYNGITAAASIEVRPLPSFIRLPYETLEIGVGDAIQLTPIVDEGSAARFSYASANSRFAAVDQEGYVTGVRTGSTEIRIRTSNGLDLILPVKVKNAPRAVKLSPEEIILGVDESMQLKAELPSNSAGTVVFDAADARIATVDASGVITAHATGETEIRVETYNGVSGSGKLTVVAAPKKIKVSAPETLGVGQEAQLSAEFLPEGSHSTARYEILSGSCVSIDEYGHITALKEGSATIRANTHVKGVYADFRIDVKPAPTAIRFDSEEYEVIMDQPLQLEPVLSPKGAVAGVSYEIERAGFFTIDENGVVTPIMRGSTRVKATTHNGLSTLITITVIDPFFPEEISFAEEPPAYLEAGDDYTPVIQVFPETAVAALKWVSSDPDIVEVDPETGKVTALTHGTVTLEAVSERNPALMLSYKLVVLSPERCLTMPNRRTDTSKISSTLSQIKKVRSSAYRELEAIYTRGEISKSEYNTRQAIISRAFDMYLFPWMTNQLEPYWKAANSENGAKDFKPGTVYYGLPYTQTNRRHNVSTVIAAGYYKDTGKGYYLLNNDKFADRAYAGNDCSSFASMAVWGTGNAHSYDSTRDIGTTSVYKTLDNWDNLRPGDLLNKYNSHVVIFLYWANEAHTQMVIIEQGGGEAATNCVSTSVRRTSYYKDKGYSVRRLASLY